MHLFEYYFEGTKTGDWMLMYQVIAKNRTSAEEEIMKLIEPNSYDGAQIKTMRCTVKLVPEYLHKEIEERKFWNQDKPGTVKVVNSAGEPLLGSRKLPQPDLDQAMTPAPVLVDEAKSHKQKQKA